MKKTNSKTKSLNAMVEAIKEVTTLPALPIQVLIEQQAEYSTTFREFREMVAIKLAMLSGEKYGRRRGLMEAKILFAVDSCEDSYYFFALAKGTHPSINYDGFDIRLEEVL